jgi:hypothetical protein
MPTRKQHTRRKLQKKANRPKSSPTVGHPQRTLGTTWPITTQVKLPYVGHATLTPGSAGAPAYVFLRAGSCYDPEYSVGGHQPLGFDQWSTFYNHYTVVGSTLKCTFHSLATAPQGPVVLGITLKDTATYTLASWTALYEDPRTNYKFVRDAPVATQTGATAVLTHSYKAKNFFNVKDVIDNTNRFGAATTADPTDNAYFMLHATELGSAFSAALYSVGFEIVYDVVLSEPKTLLGS